LNRNGWGLALKKTKGRKRKQIHTKRKGCSLSQKDKNTRKKAQKNKGRLGGRITELIEGPQRTCASPEGIKGGGGEKRKNQPKGPRGRGP